MAARRKGATVPQVPQLPPLNFAAITAKRKTNTLGLRRLVDGPDEKNVIQPNVDLRIDNGKIVDATAAVVDDESNSTALTVAMDPSRIAAFSVAPRPPNTARPLQLTAPIPPPTSLTPRPLQPSQSTLIVRRDTAAVGSQQEQENVGEVAKWPLRSLNATATTPSARTAPLALEVEAFIRRETKKLMRNANPPSQLEILGVHREALRALLSRFPEYRGVLSLIQRQYDATVDELAVSHGSLVRLEVEHKAIHVAYRLEREGMVAQHVEQVKDLQSQVAQLKKQLAVSEEARSMAEHAQMRVNDVVQEKDADIDELMERVRSLSSTLREQASKAGRYVMQLGKARTDNVRLLDLCSSLQRGFVGENNRANALEEALYEAQQTPTVKAPPPAPQGRRATKKKVILLGGEEVDVATIKKEVDGMRETAMLGMDHEELVRSVSLSGAATGAEAVAKRRSTIGSIVPGDDPTANLRMYDFHNLGEEDELREKLLLVEAELKKTQRKLAASQGEVKSVLARLDVIQRAQQDDTMTPRPQWVRIQEEIPDFQLNFLASTSDTVDDLVGYMKDKVRSELLDNERRAFGNTIVQWLGEENLCESDLLHIGKFFVGRGTGPHVPIYLRAHGKIRDMRLTKGHVETLLKKFWMARRARLKHSQVGGIKATEFDAFFLEWLTGETGSVGKAIDLAYNLLSVCARYQRDPDCGIFTRVLNGEVCELAVFDQEETVERLFEAIQKLDTRRQGLVTRISIHRVLSKLFPAKGRHDMHRLRFALITFCRGADVVDYRALFKEDGDGNQSKFIELLRSQHLQEITSHVVDVEEALRRIVVDPEDGRRSPSRSTFPNEADDGGAPPTRTMIELTAAREVLRDLDHQLPDAQLEEIIAYGCGLTTADMGPGAIFSAPAEIFLRRIRTGALLKRYSPKMKERRDSGGALTEDDEESDPPVAEASSDGDGEGTAKGARRLVKRGSLYEQNIASALQRINSVGEGTTPGDGSVTPIVTAPLLHSLPGSASPSPIPVHSPPSTAPSVDLGKVRRRKGTHGN